MQTGKSGVNSNRQGGAGPRTGITRKSFLASLAGAGAASALAQPARKPNLVFILVDDLRFDFAGALGHPWLKTPNIDRLIRGGAKFQNAFVTTSLCSPSRASILTGQYMHKHGVVDNAIPLSESIPTFPSLLQKAGYRTGFVGKWHMGGESDEPRPGFHHWVSFHGQGQYTDPPININGKREGRKGYITDVLTEEATRFIADNAARPFFLYLSHKAVHYDFLPAPRHRELYVNAPVPRPKSMAYREEEVARRPDWIRKRRYSRQGIDGLFDHMSNFDELYRNYARCCMSIDDSLGSLVSALEEKKLLQDTCVIFMGDNGYMWGEHGLVDKRTMHEPSIRVPLVVSWPGRVASGSSLPQMALNLDIGPTLLEAAGVAVPGSMHGKSLLPLLQGKSVPWRTEFLYEYEWDFDYPYTPALTGLRTEQYSYCQSYGVWDLDELYDIKRDPKQMNNLIGDARIVRQRGRVSLQIKDPELRKVVNGLQDRMAKILKDTGGDVRRAGQAGEGHANSL